MEPEQMTTEHLLTEFLCEAHENGFQQGATGRAKESDETYALRMQRYEKLKEEVRRRMELGDSIQSGAVSKEWVLNQLAGQRFPFQGDAHDYMKAQFEAQHGPQSQCDHIWGTNGWCNRCGVTNQEGL